MNTITKDMILGFSQENEAQTTPKPKKRKSVSVKSLSAQTTWQIETEEDIDRYLIKLKAMIKKELEDNTILNVEL